MRFPQTFCDFCNEPAVAVSSAGNAITRRARCTNHRVLGGEDELVYGRGKPENDWIRSAKLSLERDVMPRIRQGARIRRGAK